MGLGMPAGLMCVSQLLVGSVLRRSKMLMGTQGCRVVGGKREGTVEVVPGGSRTMHGRSVRTQ